MIKRNGEIHWYTPKLCLIRQRVQLTHDSLPVEINTNATTAPGRTARWYRFILILLPILVSHEELIWNPGRCFTKAQVNPSQLCMCVKHPTCLMSLTSILRSPKCLRWTLKWLRTQADETRVPLPCRSQNVLRIIWRKYNTQWEKRYPSRQYFWPSKQNLLVISWA